MKILVFNCGSSSAKFELIELTDGASAHGRTLARGDFDRIGEAHPEATLAEGDGAPARVAVAVRNHAEAAQQIIDWLQRQGSGRLALDATAHRIVHGGPQVFGPVLLDSVVESQLDAATAFAPLHNPPALAVVRKVRQCLPGVPAIILTDTAFHRDLPEQAREYAIPRELARRHQIRRYGFHGIGHAWMVSRYAEITGATPATLNLITLHLGAGCSATAVRGGKSVDTSMGLTPLEGLMMATRSGDLDPAIVSFLCAREQLTPAQVESLLNHQSGLLGVSGVSLDVRDVMRAQAQGNRDAALAIEGRTEAIVFGGGIGEHADDLRARILSGLQHLGIEIDAKLNRAANGREFAFASPASRIKLYVIPLNEELLIARAAAR